MSSANGGWDTVQEKEAAVGRDYAETEARVLAALDGKTLDAVVKLRAAQAEYAAAEEAWKAAQQRQMDAWKALLAVQEETAEVLGLPHGDDR